MSKVNERDMAIARAVLWMHAEVPEAGRIREVERKAEFVAAYREAVVREERSRWLVRLAELDAKLSRHFAPEAELARFLLEEAVTDVVGRDPGTPPR